MRTRPGVQPRRGEVLPMILRELPISKLNAAHYNPRKDLLPGDPEYKRIRRSIETFGLVEPLVWNEISGNLVGGHQRLKVLKEIGLKKAWVSILRIEDPKEERQLNIALNKVSGEWDIPKLKEVLLDIDDGAHDLELTGYDSGELKTLIDWDSPRVNGGDGDGEPQECNTMCPKCGHEFTT